MTGECVLQRVTRQHVLQVWPLISEQVASIVERSRGRETAETLLIEDEMYGETWSRGMTLFYLIAHQTHHRGQMTVECVRLD